MTALYLHWPFCKKKCPYCDFNSHVRDAVDYAAWQTAMLAEMRTMYERAYVPDGITSIFFGGGTPSLMPPSLVGALIAEADRLWGLSADCEITLEANPTSAEIDRFRDIHAAGVNRLSIGIQSLRDESLHFLGREHNSAQALQALEWAARIFSRYSFDLIYALPHQSLEAWEAELRTALNYAGDHLSLYQLTIEPDTAFARVYAKGDFTLPDGDMAADFYELTELIMLEHGLCAYETSNYAKAGQMSRHNLTYWRGEPYIGVGAGAHGRIITKEDGAWVATSTLKSPERWLSAVQKDGHALEEYRRLSDVERAEERLLSGLRLREGVLWEHVASIVNMQALARLISLGLIERTDTHLRTSTRGVLLVERIIGEL